MLPYLSTIRDIRVSVTTTSELEKGSLLKNKNFVMRVVVTYGLKLEQQTVIGIG